MEDWQALRKLRGELHRHPELSGCERETAAILINFLGPRNRAAAGRRIFLRIPGPYHSDSGQTVPCGVSGAGQKSRGEAPGAAHGFL